MARDAKIGFETAQEGAALLGTAVGMMMEDALPDLLQVPPKSAFRRKRQASDLQALAADIGVLASAMAVLARRSEGSL
jgi:hypothetical protein